MSSQQHNQKSLGFLTKYSTQGSDTLAAEVDDLTRKFYDEKFTGDVKSDVVKQHQHNIVGIGCHLYLIVREEEEPDKTVTEGNTVTGFTPSPGMEDYFKRLISQDRAGFEDHIKSLLNKDRADMKDYIRSLINKECAEKQNQKQNAEEASLDSTKETPKLWTSEETDDLVDAILQFGYLISWKNKVHEVIGGKRSLSAIPNRLTRLGDKVKECIRERKVFPTTNFVTAGKHENLLVLLIAQEKFINCTTEVDDLRRAEWLKIIDKTRPAVAKALKSKDLKVLQDLLGGYGKVSVVKKAAGGTSSSTLARRRGLGGRPAQGSSKSDSSGTAESSGGSTCKLRSSGEVSMRELRSMTRGGPSIPTSGGPSIPTSGGPSIPTSGGPSIPTSGGPSIPTSGGPSIPMSGGPSIPMSGGPSIPSGGPAIPKKKRTLRKEVTTPREEATTPREEATTPREEDQD